MSYSAVVYLVGNAIFHNGIFAPAHKLDRVSVAHIAVFVFRKEAAAYKEELAARYANIAHFRRPYSVTAAKAEGQIFNQRIFD